MAPAVLNFESMVKLVAIYTNKLNGLLKPEYDLVKLLFLSFAIIENKPHASTNSSSNNTSSDQPITSKELNGNEDEEDDDDLIVFSLKETDSWDDLEVVNKVDKINTSYSYISAYDLYNLVAFLLAISELKAYQSLSTTKKFAEYFGSDIYPHFQVSAMSIIRSIDPELPDRIDFAESDYSQWVTIMKERKITFAEFETPFHTSFPYLFRPLVELFGRLLYSNNIGGIGSSAKGNPLPVDSDAEVSDSDEEIDESDSYKKEEQYRARSLSPSSARSAGGMRSPSAGRSPSRPRQGSSTYRSGSTSRGRPSVSSQVPKKKKKISSDIFKREGQTKLINPWTMAQLCVMLGPDLYKKLKKLYVGSDAGFSLRSFETRVFKWRAPTLLLAAGREIDVPGSNARERQFNEAIPPLSSSFRRRVDSGNGNGNGNSNGNNTGSPKKTMRHRKSYVFGVYITEPWKAHSKNTFGNSESFIIQLEPVQDMFLAVPAPPSGPYSSSVSNTRHSQFAYFTRSQPGGVGFGSSPPAGLGAAGSIGSKSGNIGGGSSSSTSSGGGFSGFSGGGGGSGGLGGKTSGSSARYSLGNVSLTLDESLEFGVFRHVGLGGSYRPTEGIRRSNEWEDRFEISEVEVWGSGKDEDLEEQRRRWEWEEREANYRQRVNVHNMGEERAFMEMAGLIGNHGGGGSMG